MKLDRRYKYRIVRIAEFDAHNRRLNFLVGKTGKLGEDFKQNSYNDFCSGTFFMDDPEPFKDFYFTGVTVERVC